MARKPIDRKPIWDAYWEEYQRTGITQSAWCAKQDPAIDPAKFSTWTKQYKAATFANKPSKETFRALIKEEIKTLAESSRERGKEILDTALPIAASKLVSKIDSDNDAVALKASESVLDRGGLGAEKGDKIQVNVILPPLFGGADTSGARELLGGDDNEGAD